jgi:hypothetical protein
MQLISNIYFVILHADLGITYNFLVEFLLHISYFVMYSIIRYKYGSVKYLTITVK